MRKVDKIYIVCGICRREFPTWPSTAKTRKYCSRKCSNESKRQNFTPWNKGTRGLMKSNKTSFKKGLVPWNKYLEPRACIQCQEEFQPRKADGKYCSSSCYWKSLKGKVPHNKGVPMSEETKKKLSLQAKGKRYNTGKTHFKKGAIPHNKGKEHMPDEEHPNWKGDNVGYSGLHKWVARKLGKPKECEFCKQYHNSGHMMHWANKSGGYKRDTNDWLRLCAQCHKDYDLKGGNQLG